MATKAEVTGVIVSDRMDKSVVVAVERQVRDPLYGKITRRTSKFLAHDEANEARTGDLVEVDGEPVADLAHPVLMVAIGNGPTVGGGAEIEAAGFIYEGESRILRNPADKKLVWSDIKMVMRELGLPC